MRKGIEKMIDGAKNVANAGARSLAVAAVLGAGVVGLTADKAQGSMIIQSYNQIVPKNSNFSAFNTTNFTYNGETISNNAIVFMIKDNAYAGGMDKSTHPMFLRNASGHRNGISGSEPFGYNIGDLTNGANDDVIVLIDRDGDNEFDYDFLHGKLASGSQDEIRKMSKGEVTLSNESPYDGTSLGGINVIPEPTTMALLGLGAAGLAIKRKRGASKK